MPRILFFENTYQRLHLRTQFQIFFDFVHNRIDGSNLAAMEKQYCLSCFILSSLYHQVTELEMKVITKATFLHLRLL